MRAAYAVYQQYAGVCLRDLHHSAALGNERVGNRSVRLGHVANGLASGGVISAPIRPVSFLRRVCPDLAAKSSGASVAASLTVSGAFSVRRCVRASGCDVACAAWGAVAAVPDASSSRRLFPPPPSFLSWLGCRLHTLSIANPRRAFCTSSRFRRRSARCRPAFGTDCLRACLRPFCSTLR